MKRTLRIFCALLLTLALSMTAALAEPRYPARTAAATDAAAVLSASTVSDLAECAKVLEKAAGIRLHVATVDFLDGLTIGEYAAGLRSRWRLDDDDVLLLLAVGEDRFGLYVGEDAEKVFSSQVQQKLLSAHLEAAFLRQDYDGALRSFVPAMIREIGKASGKTIDIGGLLGTEKAAAAGTLDEWAEEWSRRWDDTHAAREDERRVTDEDKSTGFSLGKVILTVFLLTVIFGNHSKSRRHGQRSGCGCGCAPFSSLLAALGLWKLWDRD